MNSSVPHLAASLLAYKDFDAAFKDACKDWPEANDAYDEMKEALHDKFRQQLERIDPDAMNEDDYWPTLLDGFLWGQ
jgi:hypothetical protein